MTTTQQTADTAGIDEARQLEIKAIERKTRELKRIRWALIAWQKENIGPRMRLAIMVWLVVFGLSWVWSDAMKDTFKTYSLSPFGFTLVLATIAFVLVAKFSSSPRTHLQKLDKLLNAYEPVSKEAYRELQSKIAGIGRMDYILIEEWLVSENSAIERQQIIHRQPPSFVNRKV